MKRILCLLMILSLLLCGCASSSGDPATATPDSAASQTAPATEKAAAPTAQPPTQAPTAAPTAEQLAEIRINEILNTKKISGSASLDVDPIEQYPELPTGCEIVALTMALNYLGCDLTKIEVADTYIEYGDNYAISYVGDPHTDGGAGIWPLGIIQSVENYNTATGASIYAYNTSHLPLSDLNKFIDAGCPALVWTTYYMCEPMYTDESMEYDGDTYIWYDNEHCVTLCGYDRSAGTVDIADPLQGIVTVDADEFERINNDIGGWSVILLDASKLIEPATETQTDQPTEKSTQKSTEKPTGKANQ